MSCRSACVVAGSIPAHVARVEGADGLALVATSLGTLVTGALGDFPIDAACTTSNTIPGSNSRDEPMRKSNSNGMNQTIGQMFKGRRMRLMS